MLTRKLYWSDFRCYLRGPLPSLCLHLFVCVYMVGSPSLHWVFCVPLNGMQMLQQGAGVLGLNLCPHTTLKFTLLLHLHCQVKECLVGTTIITPFGDQEAGSV